MFCSPDKTGHQGIPDSADKDICQKHTQIIAHGNMPSSRHEMTKLILFRGHERETVVILRKPVTMTSLLFCCSLRNFIYSLLLLLTQYN